jgi:MFS family permease
MKQKKYIYQLIILIIFYHSACGFGDGLATYGLVAGLWASGFSLGAFIGPSVAGVLFDYVGFRLATYFVLTTQLLAVSDRTEMTMTSSFQSYKYNIGFLSDDSCDRFVSQRRLRTNR